MDFTDHLEQLEPNRQMMRSWMDSSGMRMSFVIAMQSHLGLLAMIRLFPDPTVIKGIASTEEEAYRRIRQNTPGMLICSDLMAEGNGFSLCRRATQAVNDLRVLMVLTDPDAQPDRALSSGARAIVVDKDFLSPEMEVMQALLAAANNQTYLSNRTRVWMHNQESMAESTQSLTEREKEILPLLLRGASDREISDHLLISIHTVKEYGRSIRRKYQVKSRLQLISALLGRNQQPSPKC